MIASIVFDDTIPVTVNFREARFEARGGWTIVEEAPGRVRLTHDDTGSVLVQSMPYTLTFGPDPAPMPVAKTKR